MLAFLENCKYVIKFAIAILWYNSDTGNLIDVCISHVKNAWKRTIKIRL